MYYYIGERSYKGFKVCKLTLTDHPFLGTLELPFIDNGDLPDSVYFSVLIGPNGTGKSELLGLLLRLLRNLYLLEKENNYIPTGGIFELELLSDGEKFLFSNKPNSYKTKQNRATKPYLLKNGEKVNFNEISKALPESIVANSILLSDKFLVLRNEKEKKQFPTYSYLGVRNSPQRASTGSYIRRTIEYIVDQFDTKDFLSGLERIVEFLDLEKVVEVQFYTSYRTVFFTGNTNVKTLIDFFEKIDEKYKNTEKIPPFKLNHFKSISQDKKLLKELSDFMNSLVIENRLEDIYRSSVKKLNYNIVNPESHKTLREEYYYLDQLRKLGIIKSPDLNLRRKEKFELSGSSSGEFHFFSTMIGLLATVKEKSLILIDEPEISLHPNWQMKYIHFLRVLFQEEKYRNSQIIIATHSHFIISDLKGISSSISGLKRENNSLKIQNFNTNTFGWSAEQVLLEVFEVATTRNFYVADKLSKIFKEVNDSGLESIDKYLDEMNFLSNNLNQSDPLKYAIDKLIERRNGKIE